MFVSQIVSIIFLIYFYFKVYVRESIENKSNENLISHKKNDSSDHSSTTLTMQSLSNLVQSGSIQIVNDINGRYQDFCKYDMQVGC